MAYKERRLPNLRKAIDGAAQSRKDEFARMARNLRPDTLELMDDVAAEGFYIRDGIVSRNQGKWRLYPRMTLAQAGEAMRLSRLPAEKLPTEIVETPLAALARTHNVVLPAEALSSAGVVSVKDFLGASKGRLLEAVGEEAYHELRHFLFYCGIRTRENPPPSYIGSSEIVFFGEMALGLRRDPPEDITRMFPFGI